VDQRFTHQALRVYQEVSLASFDLLGVVVAALFSSYPGALDRLAIHYAGAGLGISVLMRRTRTRLRRAACILSQVPSMRHPLK
jgi:hypothetical protein